MPATVWTSVLAAALHLAVSRELPLPSVMGRWVSNVGWESPRTLLIAAENGVFRYSLVNGATRMLVSRAPLPDGLPDPTAVASDGGVLVATSLVSYGGYAINLSDGKRLRAQRTFTLIPQDVAVHAGRACVLGYVPENAGDEMAVALCGGAGASWRTYEPLHRLSSALAREIHLASSIGHGGAIAAGTDGSFSVVTAAEPGIYRYSAEGKLLEVLGGSLDQYILDAMPEAVRRFPTDGEKRYRLVLNRQDIIDDLVVTPKGPALVVRRAEKEMIQWHLVWPQRDGASAPTVRLGIDRFGPFGHLRCAANDAVLACVGSKPLRRDAASPERSELRPRIWLFSLGPRSL